MAEIPERIKAGEQLELRELRKGKSHAEAERAEKRLLKGGGKGTMYPGFKQLARQVRRERRNR
jgi:hypothetical protein